MKKENFIQINLYKQQKKTQFFILFPSYFLTHSIFINFYGKKFIEYSNIQQER